MSPESVKNIIDSFRMPHSLAVEFGQREENYAVIVTYPVRHGKQVEAYETVRPDLLTEESIYRAVRDCWGKVCADAFTSMNPSTVMDLVEAEANQRMVISCGD